MLNYEVSPCCMCDMGLGPLVLYKKLLKRTLLKTKYACKCILTAE